MFFYNFKKLMFERKKEKERKIIINEIRKTLKLIKETEYAFNYAIEKDDIDNNILLFNELRKKYTQLYLKLKNPDLT